MLAIPPISTAPVSTASRCLILLFRVACAVGVVVAGEARVAPLVAWRIEWIAIRRLPAHAED